MTVLADIVSQVERAAGVYDFVTETREGDKKKIQQPLHEQQNWSSQDFFMPLSGPQGVWLHFSNLFSVSYINIFISVIHAFYRPCL